MCMLCVAAAMVGIALGDDVVMDGHTKTHTTQKIHNEHKIISCTQCV